MAAEPLARRSLRRLDLVDPLANYRPGVTERLFTNPHAGELGLYPCPLTTELQARYAQALQSGFSPGVAAAHLTGENILFTAGSVMAIDLLIRAYCEPGADRICITSPTFPAYRHYAIAGDVEVCDVPLMGEDRDRLDSEAIEATEAKLVFLCNPGSPIGSMLALKQIEALSRRLRGLLVVDEAYIEFSTGPSAVGLIEEGRHLIVLRTLSKAWGLAGARVGAAVGPPSLLHPLRVLRDPFAFDTPAQQAVQRRLDDPAAVREGVARICGERDRLAAELARLPVVTRVYPSQTNSLCVTVADLAAVFERCVAAEALVTDVSRQVPGSIRISVGARADNDRVLAALAGTNAG